MSETTIATKSRRNVAFLGGSYAISLAFGFSQFATVLLLQRIFSNEDFSRLTLILSSFASFLIIVEGGVQNDLIRRLSANTMTDDRRAALRRFRDICALLAWAGMCLYGLFAQVSFEVWLGLCVFGSSFLFMGKLLTLEAWGYSRQHLLSANSVRIARLLAVVAMLFVIISQDMGNKPLSVALIVMLFAPYPIIAFVTAFLARKELPSSTVKGNLSLLLSESIHLSAARALTWLFHFLFLVYIARLHGEAYLGDFNVATTLVVPFGMFAQILTQFLIARRFRQNAGFSTAGIFKNISIVLLGLLLYGFAVTQPRIVSILFPKAQAAAVVFYFWPMLVGNFFILINGLLEMECQNQNHRRAIVFAPAASVVAIVLWFLLSPLEFPKLYSGFIFALCCLLPSIFLAAALNKHKN